MVGKIENASANDDDADDAEKVRRQLIEARSALSAKLLLLEGRLKNSVDMARSNVEQGAQSVKQSVEDTLSSIKQTFDFKKLAARHPWGAIGGAVIAGVLLAHRARSRRHFVGDLPIYAQSKWAAAAQDAAQKATGMRQELRSRFQEEMSKLKSIAIGVGVTYARAWLTKRLPSLATHIEGLGKPTAKDNAKDQAQPTATSGSDPIT